MDKATISTEPTTDERIQAAVREAVRQCRADRDAYWQHKIDLIKTIVRQAVTLHAPQEKDRDPRWTRFVNALYGGIVRVAGPL